MANFVILKRSQLGGSAVFLGVLSRKGAEVRTMLHRSVQSRTLFVQFDPEIVSSTGRNLLSCSVLCQQLLNESIAFYHPTFYMQLAVQPNQRGSLCHALSLGCFGSVILQTSDSKANDLVYEKLIVISECNRLLHNCIVISFSICLLLLISKQYY